jgi:hypothetical protein
MDIVDCDLDAGELTFELAGTDMTLNSNSGMRLY